MDPLIVGIVRLRIKAKEFFLFGGGGGGILAVAY
jgi:hypothetical protein